VKKFPTLFDKLYASTFAKDSHHPAFFRHQELRQKIFSARRFTLDTGMSGFLGDLSSTAFRARNRATQDRAIEAMRMGARLPHKITWIEYNLRECFKRIQENKQNLVTADGGPLTSVDEMPEYEGWLLEQHSAVDTSFRATLYISDDKIDLNGFDLWSFPWSYIWSTDDTPCAFKPYVYNTEVQKTLSTLVVGLIGYQSPHINVQFCGERNDHFTDKEFQASLNLLKEWAGVVRRMWSLLATINDLPVSVSDVRPSKGYMAGRNYRRFLDHKIITLTVPQTEYVRLAKRVVVKARRRAHPVRSHWRKDWRRPFSPLCEHNMTAPEGHIECTICKGRNIWIPEHQRGDASLGHVTHDYKVTHEEEPTESS
jgi:hypothetical protein